MKTAVIISGQMRTFAKCYPTQRWQIFRHYEPDIHFFCSICDDDQSNDAEILRKDYENVFIETLQDPLDLPDIPIHKGRFAPYANANTHHKLMVQHWGNKKAWEFFCSKADPKVFDVVIRTRPDLWIHRFRPAFPNTIQCFSPWWGKFGGMNDRLAVMGIEAAHLYFNVYDGIDNFLRMGSPFHPETLLAEQMRFGEIEVRNILMTEFSTERMDGSRRWAEIVMSDIAELIANIR